MRNLSPFLAIIYAFVLVGCTAAYNDPSTPTENSSGVQIVREMPAVDSCNNPIVQIRATTGTLSSCGSAAIVEHRGRLYVLTAWHTLADGGELSIWDKCSSKINVTLGQTRKISSADVAVIPIVSGGEKLARLSLDTSGPQVSDRCKAAGFTSSGAYVEREGEITEVDVSSTCQIEHGLSGCPLILGGKVVGVTTSIRTNSGKSGIVTSGGSHVAVRDIIKLFD